MASGRSIYTIRTRDLQDAEVEKLWETLVVRVVTDVPATDLEFEADLAPSWRNLPSNVVENVEAARLNDTESASASPAQELNRIISVGPYVTSLRIKRDGQLKLGIFDGGDEIAYVAEVPEWLAASESIARVVGSVPPVESAEVR
jgi:hypothetical protein